MTISRKRLKDIEAIKEKDIDYSDILETDADFWAARWYEVRDRP